MDGLFARFLGREKRSRKSLNTIHKGVRSSMPGQAKITSYFKPAGQSNPYIGQFVQIQGFHQQTQLGTSSLLPSQSSRKNFAYCDRCNSKSGESTKD